MKKLDLEKNYRGLRVLVTGAGGFIGSHLTEMLTNLGANVTALVHYNSRGQSGWLAESTVKEEMNIVFGDVRDPFQCRRVVKDNDLVFNLAALIGIPYSYHAPSSYIQTNLEGTMNILEAVRANNSTRLIQMSTSEVYGSALNTPMDENHPLQPQSPYSASKIAADSIALSYFSSFGVEVIVGRPFNTFGPRQSRRAVIPTIISQILTGSGRVYLGNVESVRDFTYVKDTCRSLCEIAICDQACGQAVNIGTGIALSVNNLFNKIRDIMSIDSELEVVDERLRPDLSEVTTLVCNNEKLYKLTKTRPVVELEIGLQYTIDWFRHRTHHSSDASQDYVI